MSKTATEMAMTALTGIEFEDAVDARAEAYAVIEDLLDAIYRDGINEKQSSVWRTGCHFALAKVKKNATELVDRYRKRHTSGISAA